MVRKSHPTPPAVAPKRQNTRPVSVNSVLVPYFCCCQFALPHQTQTRSSHFCCPYGVLLRTIIRLVRCKRQVVLSRRVCSLLPLFSLFRTSVPPSLVRYTLSPLFPHPCALLCQTRINAKCKKVPKMQTTPSTKHQALLHISHSITADDAHSTPVPTALNDVRRPGQTPTQVGG